MKKTSKTKKSVRKSIRYYIEKDRKNSIYRAVAGGRPEYKNLGSGWTLSDDYPTEAHLKASNTVDGSNYGVKRISYGALIKS